MDEDYAERAQARAAEDRCGTCKRNVERGFDRCTNCWEVEKRIDEYVKSAGGRAAIHKALGVNDAPRLFLDRIPLT